MNARFLVNPTAGRGKAAAALEVIEPRVGRENVVVTGGAEHLRQEARRAISEGIGRVVVAGGDGTAHQVVQELAGEQCALAVLPLGSGNDLAATLGMPADLRAAVDVSLEAPVRAMDLGRIGGRYFALYCGLGFDGEVSRTYNEKVRWVKGPAGYVWATLRAMMSFEPPTLTIDDDAGGSQGRMMLAVAANAPRCGGGMQIAPMAAIDDGRFELVTLDAVPRRALLFLLSKVFRGAHLGHPKVHHRTVSRLRISSDRPLWAYGDGEPLLEVGAEPVEVEILPAHLRVVARAASSRR
jgi:diacylglycerol kinase (ATP)